MSARIIDDLVPRQRDHSCTNHNPEIVKKELKLPSGVKKPFRYANKCCERKMIQLALVQTEKCSDCEALYERIVGDVVFCEQCVMYFLKCLLVF